MCFIFYFSRALALESVEGRDAFMAKPLIGGSSYGKRRMAKKTREFVDFFILMIVVKRKRNLYKINFIVKTKRNMSLKYTPFIKCR
jgi:hypothetical protein